jgi:ABC-2 type transport system permease protein
MIYFKYLAMNMREFMQHRAAMLMSMLANALGVLASLTGIWVLFARFGTIKGYTFAEVAVCYACVYFAFSAAQMFGEGFDDFSRLVRDGSFDRMLLRPRTTELQVFGSNFDVVRAGKIAISFVIYAVALPNLRAVWTLPKVISLILMNLSGTVIFIGIYILGAAVCFWTIEGLEFLNILTNGGNEMLMYPLTIYPKGIILFFTFIIPFGCFNYLPLLYITGRADNPLYALTPLLGILFIAPCLAVWRVGVRHYLSTGN